MRIIDAEGAVLGRLASLVAKEVLKGEKIIIVNCEKVRITGRERKIREDFEKKRKRVGSGQKGPKFPRTAEKIVKRVIRGMLPDHRKGRGKEAYKKIKCFSGIPEEFKNLERQTLVREIKNKSYELKNFVKK